MKPIKEWTFRYWVVAYLALMGVLAILSSILSKQGIDIHASFILMAVMLVHLILTIKKIISDEKKLLRQLFILVLVVSIVKVALLEFYHAVNIVDKIYGVLLVIFVVAFAYTSITGRIAKRKADKQKMEEVLKKEELKEAEILDTVDVPVDENQSTEESTEEELHNPVEENDETKDTI